MHTIANLTEKSWFCYKANGRQASTTQRLSHFQTYHGTGHESSESVFYMTASGSTPSSDLFYQMTAKRFLAVVRLGTTELSALSDRFGQKWTSTNNHRMTRSRTMLPSRFS